MRFFAVLLLLSLATRARPAFGAAGDPIPMTIGATYVMHSTVLGEDRAFAVHLPASYDLAASVQRRYPVLYVLDGERFFRTVGGMTDFMSSARDDNFTIPEMIVVGVFDDDRIRDFTPTHSLLDAGGVENANLSTSGGAEAFIRFLKDELVPRIDHDYRTMPYRVVVGDAFGGLAAIDAVQTTPSLFQATIGIDPSLWWDDALLVQRERETPHNASPFGRLYLSLSNRSPIDGIPASVVGAQNDAIRNYAHLVQSDPTTITRFRYGFFADEDARSAPLAATYAGLKFVFEGYDLSLADGLNDPSDIGPHFERFSSKVGTAFFAPEALLDELGRFALESLHDADKAIVVFTLDATSYPQSSSAYDGLAGAYLAKGDRTRSASNYERALQLDAQNADAKTQLEKLRSTH